MARLPAVGLRLGEMPSPVEEPGALLRYSVCRTSCDELETLAASPSVMFITRIAANE